MRTLVLLSVAFVSMGTLLAGLPSTAQLRMNKAPTLFIPPKSLLLATPVPKRAGPPRIRVPRSLAKLPPPITYSCRGAIHLPTQSFDSIENARLDYFTITNPGTGDLFFDGSSVFGTTPYGVASEGGLLRMDDLERDFLSVTFEGGAYNGHWIEFPAFDPASGGFNAKMTYTWKPDPSKPAQTVLYYLDARCSKI